MTHRRIWIAIVLAVALAPAAAMAQVARDADAAYAEMREMFGRVPTFLRLYPRDALPGAWQEMKAVQLSPDTAIPGQYKELIGLAVAAGIPCDYCVYFHKNAAKAQGATDAQVAETLAMAGLVRHWSTILNGMRVDPAQFRKETARIFRRLERQEVAGAAAGRRVTDAESAFADMKRTLGEVPQMFREIPREAVPGAWMNFKALAMDQDAAVPNKYKELAGLAVAGSIPCEYCAEYHQQAARAAGASEQEIKEAVAMGGITRRWSTFLNGLDLDEAEFRRETDAMLRHVAQAQGQKATPNRKQKTKQR